MSNLADDDAGRQQQLGSSGEYNPTGRAAAGARAAKAAGAGSHPVVSDGPSSGEKSFDTPAGSKEPKPQATPKVPAEKDQGGSDILDNARSVADRRA